jgi:hypothetical protein
MNPSDEAKRLVNRFSDRSRHVQRARKKFMVPHKFTDDGTVIDTTNFDPRIHLSCLDQDDFRLLAALQDKRWDLPSAAAFCKMDLAIASKRMKRLNYFEFEDKRAASLAAIATPDFVAAKNLEGFYTDQFTDGQRDHLKELAKITGSYKQQAPTNQVNVFNINLTPEQEAQLKPVFDAIATDSAHDVE